MKIFLIILLCIAGWIISVFLSALIIKNVFCKDGGFYSFVCSVLAPITFVVVLIILPFWFFYILIDGIVG